MKTCLTWIVFSFSIVACSMVDVGMPFGKITDDDMVHLTEFAKKQGMDLGAEAKKAYAKDKQALARVFELSLSFDKLDRNARTYGQVIYSSFLNLGESMGVKEYSRVLASLSPEVRQRVRDFIYYPITRLPKTEREENEKQIRKDYPELIPTDYRFGMNNPIFK